MNDSDQKTGKPRALVFVWGGIGNMVMALPMIAALKGGGRVSDLGMVVQKSAMLELIDTPAFRLALSLDDARYTGLMGSCRMISALRAFRPNLTFSSASYPRSYGLLALAAGAHRRICEDVDQHWLCNEAVKTASAHIVHRNLEMLKPLGVEPPEPDYSLLYRGDPLAILRTMGLEPNPGIIGVFPGAGHHQRRWPIQNYRALIGKLAARYQVIIFADPNDRSSADDLAAGAGNKARIFAGPLRQKLSLLPACRLFISANTGLAHCAAALGVTTLELEGPTDPAVYSPLGKQVTIIQGNAPCAPCYRSGNRYGCDQREPTCMAGITVGQVLDEAERMITGRP